MKWTVARMKRELEKVSAEFGDVFNIDIAINSRLTRTHGRCMYHIIGGVVAPYRIEMSKQLLETATDDGIIDILKHEWAHYYITKTTKKNQGHNAKFKSLCAAIGCVGLAASPVERHTEVEYKYEVFCTCCGKRAGAYNRAGQVVKEPQHYHSKCCKAKLRVQTNW